MPRHASVVAPLEMVRNDEDPRYRKKGKKPERFLKVRGNTEYDIEKHVDGHIQEPEHAHVIRRRPRLHNSAKAISDMGGKCFEGGGPNLGASLYNLNADILDEGRDASNVTRLAKSHEQYPPEAMDATRSEKKKALIDAETLGQASEEDAPPTGIEVADLGDVLSLKDMETPHPEWKAWIIFRGGGPVVISGKKPGGSNICEPLSENQCAWACTTADHTAARMALAYTMCKNCQACICDLASAYLHAEAGGRETYVRVKGSMKDVLPEVFKKAVQGMGKPVLKLEKALYGRTRGGFDWAQKRQGVLDMVCPKM